MNFLKLYLNFPEFRLQVWYRVNPKHKIIRLILRLFTFFDNLNLYFACPCIDGGLFIEHGFSTIIACKSIGKNCWINQQVTIGYSDKDKCPIIGDDVQIKAGAKIIGNISIGDDVIIGAGSVVVKSVPPHSVVVGVPAKVIKTRNSHNENWKII